MNECLKYSILDRRRGNRTPRGTGNRNQLEAQDWELEVRQITKLPRINYFFTVLPLA